MLMLVYRILFNALGIILIAEVVPGIDVDGVYAAIVTVIILGLLNAIVRPILFILTLPITILTLGLFAFVINAGIFLFVASFIEGFEVSGFWTALLGSLLMSIVSTLGNKWLKNEQPKPAVEYKEIQD